MELEFWDFRQYIFGGDRMLDRVWQSVDCGPALNL